MRITAELKSTLLHALEQRDHAFAEALEDFDDCEPEDIENFNRTQADAEAWVNALEVEA